MAETIVNISLPRQLLATDFEVKRILVNGNLAIKITQLNTVTGISVQYSINGVNYSTNNTFPNISEGNYNLRVRDNYGCVLSIPFFAENPTPDQIMKPLKDLNWSGQYDKTSPASAVFNSSVFANELNEFLVGTTQIVTETVTIKGTRKEMPSLCFPFSVKEDSDEQLESEKQEFCINADCSYEKQKDKPKIIIGEL